MAGLSRYDLLAALFERLNGSDAADAANELKIKHWIALLQVTFPSPSLHDKTFAFHSNLEVLLPRYLTHFF